MTPRRQGEAAWNEKKQAWLIKVQKDGIRRQFSSSVAGRKGKRIAEARADAWLESTCPDTARFPAVWSAYLETKKLNVGTSRLKQLGTIYKNQLAPVIGNKVFANISDQDWQDCIDRAARLGLSRQTLQALRAVINNLCKFARKKRLIDVIPADLTIPRAAADPRPHRILSPADLQMLFSPSVSGEYLQAYRLAVLTGMRPGELLGLQWSDIDGSVLHIQRAKNVYNEITGGKTANARRDIYLHPRALAALEAQRKQNRAAGILSPWVFPDARQQNVYLQWKKFCKRYGITPCTLYELRHTMISYMKADVPEILLKRAVGHSGSMDTFGVYGHNTEGDAERAGASISAVFDHILSDTH